MSEGHLPSKENAMSGSWCFMSTLQCVQGLLETHQSKRTCGCIIMRLAISFFQSLSIILVESLKCSRTVLKTNSLKRFVSIRLLPESEKAGGEYASVRATTMPGNFCSKAHKGSGERTRPVLEAGKRARTAVITNLNACTYIIQPDGVSCHLWNFSTQESAKNWWKMPKISGETPIYIS